MEHLVARPWETQFSTLLTSTRTLTVVPTVREKWQLAKKWQLAEITPAKHPNSHGTIQTGMDSDV